MAYFLPALFGAGSGVAIRTALITLARTAVITYGVYLASDAVSDVSDDIHETITPTTPLPDGRGFTIPKSLLFAVLVLSIAYAFDKIAKPFLKK
jgi:hypothetical protein